SLSYGSLTTYQQFDFPGGANGKSHIIINSPLKVTDNIGGSAVITTITTGSTSPGTVFYDFGKIESVSLRTKDLAGGLNALQTTTYNYGSNWAALKGKPESETVYSDIDPTGANSITRSTEYTYYSNGDLQTVTTDPGTQNEKVTTYTYDYQSSSDPYGNVTQTDLNAVGVAGGPITNIYTYTADGKFLASKVNPVGYTTTYSYGNLSATWGNMSSSTNHKGLQTQYTYDAINRLRVKKDVFSNIESYTDYTWASSSSYAGSLTGAHIVVSASNSYDAKHSAKVFDIYGRTLREVSPGFNWGDIYIDYTYGTNGQVATARGPYNSGNPAIPTPTTTYTYDDYNRETQRSTDNNGATIQTSYTVNNGLLHTTVINQGANTWKTSVTCGKTLRSVISSGTPNHTIDYTYHGNGAVATTVVNSGSGSGKTFTNLVDAYGRITDKTEPNAGTITYAYDALDRVVTETRANGTAYQYDYDLLGRVWQKHISGMSQPYTYTYQNVNGWGSTGELMQQTSPNGHVKDYTYGTEGWLHSIMEDNFFETIYSYYPNGDLRLYTFDNDLTIEYNQYDYGVPMKATLLSGSNFTANQRLWDGWGLNEYGQRKGAYYYDASNQPGYADRRTYDVHGRFERHEMINVNQANLLIADNLYSFDIHTGNLAWRKDDLPMRDNTEYFTYDNHYDHLKTVSQSVNGGPTIQVLGMAYDEHGNIKEKDDVAPVLTHQWKYDDYALETVEMPGAPPFPASVAIPHFRQDITYTPFEKVERMREDQNNEVFFTYGADDQRVQATY
ncbi:MAG TPA: RHS repeat domain-containing protein, partial [Flavipsychrobacter sp.]